MLFDKVPGLVGSGIITQQFKEIRQTVMYDIVPPAFRWLEDPDGVPHCLPAPHRPAAVTCVQGTAISVSFRVGRFKLSLLC